MFRINPDPTFECSVDLTLPGGKEAGRITFTFRSRSRRELRAWEAAAEARRTDDAAWLAEVIADWSGPVDDQGLPVPYSVEKLRELLNSYPASATEIFLAYGQAYLPARRGNS